MKRSGQQLKGRDAILRAARETFAAKGFDGASIRDIANTAGLNLSALYYYFDSKQAALFELIRTSYQEFNTAIDEALNAAEPDPVARVAVFVRVLVRYRAANLASSRLLLFETERLSEDYRPEIDELRVFTRGQLYEQVRLGKEQGVFDIDNPDLAARSILAISNVLPQWWNPDGPLQVDDLEREYLEQSLRILGCTERGPRLTATTLPPIPSDA
ncbi:hypothetical protein HMPREF3172_05250 [Brevibacterium sp. HMSC08F02]|uniref:TetR/AcrR family transcriptional regulator n=1 Tax=Brevibacterium sp. HMSC08F02 TaxID=1581140 RepID=UPI0008A33AF3|nr:TetR/AcrR family transcriptional regulator [Brevibacterium sp. HMSC08F02]OFT25915.1 hypothetical protein HMPREF3172_05250 [Brevibacterium sp. HMSC08F02]